MRVLYAGTEILESLAFADGPVGSRFYRPAFEALPDLDLKSQPDGWVRYKRYQKSDSFAWVHLLNMWQEIGTSPEAMRTALRRAYEVLPARLKSRGAFIVTATVPDTIKGGSWRLVSINYVPSLRQEGFLKSTFDHFISNPIPDWCPKTI